MKDFKDILVKFVDAYEARTEALIKNREEAFSKVQDSQIPDPVNPREALLEKCAELGIEVPPRTKTNTLVKLINEKEKELNAPTNKQIEDEIPVTKPQSTMHKLDLGDETASSTGQKKVYTHKDVVAVLQRVMLEHNTAAVIDLIKEIANVTRVDKITPDLREAVIEAAKSRYLS